MESKKNFNDLMNEKEAADRLNLNPATLRNWRYLRKGPAYAILGRHIVYPRESLEKFIRENLVDPEA